MLSPRKREFLSLSLYSVLSETWLVFAGGVAAGAMLKMIAAAMIPKAAAHGKPSEVGLNTLAGFLAAVLCKLYSSEQNLVFAVPSL